jgi:21S rRNA (GM2251-2'-O)-methyltransferase
MLCSCSSLGASLSPRLSSVRYITTNTAINRALRKPTIPFETARSSNSPVAPSRAGAKGRSDRYESVERSGRGPARSPPPSQRRADRNDPSANRLSPVSTYVEGIRARKARERTVAGATRPIDSEQFVRYHKHVPKVAVTNRREARLARFGPAREEPPSPARSERSARDGRRHGASYDPESSPFDRILESVKGSPKGSDDLREARYQSKGRDFGDRRGGTTDARTLVGEWSKTTPDNFPYDRTRRTNTRYKDDEGTSDNFALNAPEARGVPRESARDFIAPRSIPYTTAASEFLYGYSVVLAAVKANRRKLYNLYCHPRVERHEGYLVLERLAKQSRVNIQHVDDSWLPLMDKMSSGRPHNVRSLISIYFQSVPFISHLCQNQFSAIHYQF